MGRVVRHLAVLVALLVTVNATGWVLVDQGVLYKPKNPSGDYDGGLYVFVIWMLVASPLTILSYLTWLRLGRKRR